MHPFAKKMAAARAAAAKRRAAGAAAPKKGKRRRRNPELLQLMNPAVAKPKKGRRKARSRKPRSRARNPSSSIPAAALAAYREFHGVDPKAVRQVDSTHPVLIALGQLNEVVYKPTRGERKGPAFFHRFGKGATLAATPDGRHLELVPAKGKPFRVHWDRGIVG